jgi:hypothetical protein
LPGGDDELTMSGRFPTIRSRKRARVPPRPDDSPDAADAYGGEEGTQPGGYQIPRPLEVRAEERDVQREQCAEYRNGQRAAASNHKYCGS